MNNLVIVTEKNIESLLEKHPIIVLDFWASWCAPCKAFSPIFERVAEKNPDILFGKVNTETELTLSSDFEIRSIPTLAILKERTIIYHESGVIPEYALTNIVAKSRTINPEEI